MTDDFPDIPRQGLLGNEEIKPHVQELFRNYGSLLDPDETPLITMPETAEGKEQRERFAERTALQRKIRNQRRQLRLQGKQIHTLQLEKKDLYLTLGRALNAADESRHQALEAQREARKLRAAINTAINKLGKDHD